MLLFGLLTALSLAFCISAQNVTNCVRGGVCYAVNIPEASSSGSGDIFIHVTGPSSMSWIGIGQGSSMNGANIFMIHANEGGDNVTLSPRLGLGQRQPLNSGSTAQVTLLSGSGIAAGMMTANFMCSNCNSWDGGSMSFTDTQSDWIWAYRSGASVFSNSLSANLNEHSNYGDMTLNLQTAAGGSSANPFLGAIASETTASNPNTNTGGGSDSTSTEAGSSGYPSNFNTVLIAHAVLGPVAFVVLYPLGAIAIRIFRFPNVVWFHAGWMVFTYLIVLTSMGLGVWLAVTGDYLSEYHAIIGLVVVGCLLLQPITGLLHHRLFKSRGRSNAATFLHVWWGRAIVTLGIINGGLGLQLAGNTRNGEIVYGVVAGFMWVLWMGIVLLAFVRRRGETKRTMSNRSQEKPSLQQESLRLSDERR